MSEMPGDMIPHVRLYDPDGTYFRLHISEWDRINAWFTNDMIPQKMIEMQNEYGGSFCMRLTGIIAIELWDQATIEMHIDASRNLRDIQRSLEPL